MSEYLKGSHPDPVELDIYLDGELNGSDLDRFEAHLDECAACRKSLDERQVFFDLIAESEQVPFSRDISGDVVGALAKNRLRLLAGVLSFEVVLAASVLLLSGPRLAAQLPSSPYGLYPGAGLAWAAGHIEWGLTQLRIGLNSISQSLHVLPMPGLPELPTGQLTWLHICAGLAGLFFFWLLTNRILIGDPALKRSRL